MMLAGFPEVATQMNQEPIMEDWDCDEHVAFLSDIIRSGGPYRSDWPQIDEWIQCLFSAVDRGEIGSDAHNKIRLAMGPVLDPSTMFGWAYRKPHGYAGDFEIIERHYTRWICPDARLVNWDRYWHRGAAAQAVRNRRAYFHELLQRHCDVADGKAIEVLNIASGPARDVFEFLSNSSANIRFECVDHDPRAIAYASKLCRPFNGATVFHQANALRLRPAKRYDLIWIAGLFDYFNDRVFKLMLKRLLPFIAPGGQLVIGNFHLSETHPNFSWMRFCEWILHYRTGERLKSLTFEAGINPDRVRIGHEPEGVNLFLHIRG
jgi:extracellular factor (EF) 3-hydroxypalmitic acid methyl ester biosynthesis protein